MRSAAKQRKSNADGRIWAVFNRIFNSSEETKIRLDFFNRLTIMLLQEGEEGCLTTACQGGLINLINQADRNKLEVQGGIKI